MSPVQLPATLRHPVVRDVAVVLGWFALAAVLGALVWWQVTPLAEYTRTATSAQMGEDQLGRQVSTDGWFFAIAAVGGLLSGIALLAWRHRDPLVMVILVTAGGLLASLLMARLGLWLGPDDPKHVLLGVPVGDKVPLQLKAKASGVFLVWPIAALVGAVGVIWGLDEHRHVHGADGQMPANVPEDASGAEIRRLVTAARFTPVRLREGYDMNEVDRLLDRVTASASRGEPVAGLLEGTELGRTTMREAYDIGEVDRLLERIRAAAKSSMTG